VRLEEAAVRVREERVRLAVHVHRLYAARAAEAAYRRLAAWVIGAAAGRAVLHPRLRRGAAARRLQAAARAGWRARAYRAALAASYLQAAARCARAAGRYRVRVAAAALQVGLARIRREGGRRDRLTH
jgi:hypothetical protein